MFLSAGFQKRRKNRFFLDEETNLHVILIYVFIEKYISVCTFVSWKSKTEIFEMVTFIMNSNYK